MSPFTFAIAGIPKVSQYIFRKQVYQEFEKCYPLSLKTNKKTRTKQMKIKERNKQMGQQCHEKRLLSFRIYFQCFEGTKILIWYNRNTAFANPL